MAKYWYRVDLKGGNNRTFCGSFELGLDELKAELSSAAFIRMNDLFYRDNQNKFQPWSRWEPRLQPAAIIRCSEIIAVMSFQGDPSSEIGSA